MKNIENSIGLRVTRDHEQQETQHLETAEHVPVEEPAGLHLDDHRRTQRAVGQEHADRGEAERQLVADHLRRRAQAAHQGVLAARGPAGTDDAVHAETGRGQREQHPAVEVEDHEIHAAPEDLDHRTERNDGEGAQRGDEGNRRSKHEQRLVRALGEGLVFHHELDPVGDRLQQAERPDPVGADAVLDDRRQPSFDPGHQRHANHQHLRHDEDLGETD